MEKMLSIFLIALIVPSDWEKSYEQHYSLKGLSSTISNPI
jgi:hypothetical protein